MISAVEVSQKSDTGIGHFKKSPGRLSDILKNVRGSYRTFRTKAGRVVEDFEKSPGRQLVLSKKIDRVGEDSRKFSTGACGDYGEICTEKWPVSGGSHISQCRFFRKNPTRLPDFLKKVQQG
jgi:hypothetical protein